MNNFPDYKTVSVDSLIPYARNSRTHSDEQVAQIAASIKEFGFTNPVLIDGEGGIIAGHGRVMAARKLGIDEVPCITLDYLTGTQKRAYIIADNKLALNAGWDDEMLRIEFDELEEFGFDLELTGFQDYEIDMLDEGWDSDLEPVERHGENLDGIGVILRIKVDNSDEEQAQELITNALDLAGVEYEWG